MSPPSHANTFAEERKRLQEVIEQLKEENAELGMIIEGLTEENQTVSAENWGDAGSQSLSTDGANTGADVPGI